MASTDGPIIRHGPHHSAQKSTSTALVRTQNILFKIGICNCLCKISHFYLLIIP